MSGWEQFKKFLAEYSWLSVWTAGAGSAVIPFVASFLAIIPPWPSGLSVITAVIQVAALALSFQIAPKSGRAIATNMKRLGAVAFIGLLLYIALFTMFTIYVPPAKRSIVIGFNCTAEAQKIFQNCPFLTIDDLARAAFDEFVIWTRVSIMATRTMLIGIWLALFICLALLLGQFIAFQMRRRLRK